MCVISETVGGGFLWVLQFPPILDQLMVSVIQVKQSKCDFISVKLDNETVSLHCVGHVTGCTRQMPDVLLTIFT